MVGHEAIQGLMDRELDILERRVLKSGPNNHFAIARYDALREITADLQRQENFDASGTVRSAIRRLDALTQRHPSLLSTGQRPRRTIERSEILRLDLLAEIAGYEETSLESERASYVPTAQAIRLSGTMWRANSYPSKPRS
jgi:hypothetical protein